MIKLKNSDTIFSIESLRHVLKEDNKEYGEDTTYSIKMTWFDEQWVRHIYGTNQDKRDEDYQELLDILTKEVINE